MDSEEEAVHHQDSQATGGASDDYSPKQVEEVVEKLIKLMIGSEQKVVSEFNRIFNEICPKAGGTAENPFRTTSSVVQIRY